MGAVFRQEWVRVVFVSAAVFILLMTASNETINPSMATSHLTVATTHTPPDPRDCNPRCNAKISATATKYCLITNFSHYSVASLGLKSGVDDPYNYTALFNLSARSGTTGYCDEPRFGYVMESWNVSSGALLHELAFVEWGENNASIESGNFTKANFTYIPLYNSTITKNTTVEFSNGNFSKADVATGSSPPGYCNDQEQNSFTDYYYGPQSAWALCLNETNTETMINDLEGLAEGTGGITIILDALCFVTAQIGTAVGCLPALIADVVAGAFLIDLVYIQAVNAQSGDRGVTFEGSDIRLCSPVNWWVWWQWSCTTSYSTGGWGLAITPNQLEI
jgi:hypothetical protein